MTAAGLPAATIDVDLLTAYAVAVDVMTRAGKELNQTIGVTVPGKDAARVRHPATIVLGQATRLIDTLAATLGTAPAARDRRHAQPDTEATRNDPASWYRESM